MIDFRRLGCASAAVMCSVLLSRCSGPRAGEPTRTLQYVGSSTVARCLADLSASYPALRFEMDTAGESAGGERAILEGRCILAGIADLPSPETLRAGIEAVHIAQDAIAVLVHESNPIQELSGDQLRALFTGQVANWSELGGSDLPIRALVTDPQSATHQVFRRGVLGDKNYAQCEVVSPDAAMVAAVAADPRAVGQISFSFLDGATGVRALAVDGQRPSVTNFDYPISRPLYLLAHEGDPALDRFLQWIRGEEGQRAVMKDFVGVGVKASFEPTSTQSVQRGFLVVYTDTEPFYDGGIYYYPHRPFDLCTRYGDRIRRVANHRGDNDEDPTRLELEPGVYLIRTKTHRSGAIEFFVTVDAHQTTTVDVLEWERSR